MVRDYMMLGLLIAVGEELPCRRELGNSQFHRGWGFLVSLTRYSAFHAHTELFETSSLRIGRLPCRDVSCAMLACCSLKTFIALGPLVGIVDVQSFLTAEPGAWQG